jgi:2-polyprenyl-6-methoxyphenol hydroxylase-like FAD-dependent oxidoreductase
VILLGDAAHAVSLLAGQGASLAVAGADLLARELTRRDSTLEALQAYDRTLRPVVAEKRTRARNAARWFVPTTPTQRHPCRFALHAARFPFADRLLTTSLVGKQSILR